MSMIVSSAAFDPIIPGMMTLVGTPSGSPAMNFNSGNSANHIYSGVDHAGVAATVPAFGTTNTVDAAIADLLLDAELGRFATLLPAEPNAPRRFKLNADLLRKTAQSNSLADIDNWFVDTAGLSKPADEKYGRALLSYYFDQFIKPGAPQRARWCKTT